MTSTIKVDNIQNQCGTNIVKRCGTTTTVGSGASNTIVMCGSTVTIGRCGGTVALAAGASQTGFGRTGAVDWDTTAKTTGFTAVSGNGYFVNTTSGTITVTLPATPSAGDIVSVKDYAYTFATNNLTVGRNGSKIGGQNTADLTVSTNGSALTFIYVDATQGWLVVNESTDTSQGLSPAYITATGGCVTTCGDDKIHTFTGPGTFSVTCAGNPAGSTTYSYHIIAGGGGAGQGYGSNGGAGGYRSGGCYGPAPLRAAAGTASTGCFPITVGGGGAGRPPGPYGPGNNGSNSTGFCLTAAGGGYGAGAVAGPSAGANGGPGGSGGGATGGAPGSSSFTGGTGNTPPVSPPQGKNGAPSALGNPYPGYHSQGGGAGNDVVPQPFSASNPTGVPSLISGSDFEYAAGGPIYATANRGFGGNSCAGNGSSGVVIIRYKYQN